MSGEMADMKQAEPITAEEYRRRLRAMLRKGGKARAAAEKLSHAAARLPRRRRLIVGTKAPSSHTQLGLQPIAVTNITGA